MPWWILEVATTLVLVAIAVWLGPFIKRFGRAYAADVFHDNPLTGKSYIVLTDIVYYLIFAAYILFTVHFAPQSDWNNDVTGLVTAEQLTGVGARGSAASCSSSASCTASTSCSCRCSAGCSRSTARLPAEAARTASPCATREHRRVEVGVVEHPGRPRGRVDLGEVEPLAADVAGVHRGCRVGLAPRRPHRSARCRAGTETSNGTSTHTRGVPEVGQLGAVQEDAVEQEQRRAARHPARVAVAPAPPAPRRARPAPTAPPPGTARRAGRRMASWSYWSR